MKNRILAATIAITLTAGGFALGRTTTPNDCTDMVDAADRTIRITAAMVAKPDNVPELLDRLAEVDYATARAECVGESR